MVKDGITHRLVNNLKKKAEQCARLYMLVPSRANLFFHSLSYDVSLMRHIMCKIMLLKGSNKMPNLPKR